MATKTYCEACERNKTPILEKLKNYLEQNEHLLEIGSGTGQHAVFFTENLPFITWQPSDRQDYLENLHKVFNNANLSNLSKPIELDVMNYDWGKETYSTIYTANVLHIMPWEVVLCFLSNVSKALKPNGKLIIYGPFCYDGEFTSPSNADFDSHLKSTDPQMGIRDFNQVNDLLKHYGFRLLCDHTMPANNQLIVWELSVCEGGGSRK